MGSLLSSSPFFDASQLSRILTVRTHHTTFFLFFVLLSLSLSYIITSLSPLLHTAHSLTCPLPFLPTSRCSLPYDPNVSLSSIHSLPVSLVNSPSHPLSSSFFLSFSTLPSHYFPSSISSSSSCYFHLNSCFASNEREREREK